jgi:hypothetical protein
MSYAGPTPLSLCLVHEGIVSDLRGLDGLPYVISNSARAGQGAEEPWQTFTGGRKAHLLRNLSTRLLASTVLARARSMLNEKWDIFTWNCQHFVREALGLTVESPQLQIAGWGAFALLVGAVVTRKK